MGHDVAAGVVAENAPSQALFEKLGFTRASSLYWMIDAHVTDESN